MKLHCVAASPNARKAIAVAKELGVPLDIVPLNIPAGDTKKPDYLALNPNGKFPTLTDGDFSLWESNAIMKYIASKKPNTLWPDDAREQADVDRWLFWEAAHFTPACSPLVYERFVKSVIFNRGPADLDVIAKAEGTFHQYMKVLEHRLAAHDYLVGNHLTLADLAIAPILDYAEMCQYPMADYPHTMRWLNRMRETAIFANSKAA
ncbi:glutathione S-transferase family protein [Dyella psychrodurans]|uniref:Glutathione S-transferase family protein n=1 Tax=Dyella psychrodurans TaxID=1927960 RepID=A0A370XDZ1_9GAMM|nr:glutathione S-transferase family protein [Dyella psychrodurans]RDS86628.1 glutathione S-transferase family protein [Dyella psychrodurans]